jgi:hypothetical protein
MMESIDRIKIIFIINNPQFNLVKISLLEMALDSSTAIPQKKILEQIDIKLKLCSQKLLIFINIYTYDYNIY